MTDATGAENARQTRLKMLKIRSWRRGTKEMDLLLGPFADEPLRDLLDADLDAYEALLEEVDQDLYNWCSTGDGAPERYHAILGQIRAFHKIS